MSTQLSFRGAGCIAAAVILNTSSTQAALIAHWPMEDLIGNSVSDISGNSHHGIATGTTVDCGCQGLSREFASPATDYIEVPDHPDFHLAGDFSITALVRLASIPNPEGKILAKFSSYQSTNGYEISIGSDGRFAFEISDEVVVGQTVKLRSDEVLIPDECYRLAAIRRSDSMEIFVNGVVSGKAVGPTQLLSDPANIRIGHRALGPNDQGFPGHIDDVKIYNHALSQEELTGNEMCNVSSIVSCPFERQDANCDGVVDIVDVVKSVARAFRGEPAEPPCCDLISTP